MKRFFFSLLIGCLSIFLTGQAKATDAPNWKCYENGYEYDMSIYMTLERDGQPIIRWDDFTIAAFCDGDCRGISTFQEVEIQGVKYYYIRVRSNVASGEKISFKSFDKKNGRVEELLNSVDFVNLKQYGYPSSPIILNLPPVSISSVSLNKNSSTLWVQQKDTLSSTIYPVDASSRKVTWSSSDELVASVTPDGIVTALKSGKSIITVKTEDGGFVSFCDYTVLQPVTGVTLNRYARTLWVAQLDTLTATATPSDAYNKKVTWSSSDELVASVTPDGIVTALKSGKSIITVKTEDGGFVSFCDYTVLQPVTGVTLNRYARTLWVAQLDTLTAKITPFDAYNKNVTWSSSDQQVASVTPGGVLSALKSGVSTITVKTEDGHFLSSCDYTILQHVTGVALNKNKDQLYIGQENILTATVAPLDASNKNLKWSTSNDKIVVTTQSGLIKGLRAGLAIVYVSTEDGTFKDSCEVTIIPQMIDVQISYGLNGMVFYDQEKLQNLDQIQIAKDSLAIFTIQPDEKYVIDSVLFNNVDVFSQLKKSNDLYIFTTDAITSKSNIVVKFKLKVLLLTIKSADNGTVALETSPDTHQTIVITPSDGWMLYSVSFNDEDVTAEIVDKKYTTPLIAFDCMIHIILTKSIYTSTLSSSNKVQLSSRNGQIKIKGLEAGENISVYDLNGNVVDSRIAFGDELLFDLVSGIYIVHVNEQIFKILN